ncbi:MAG: hypothetical protein FWG87_11605 [Defluviitaleaceae bacterium]|nr:hypothetical protein [Defluviitaleaceae bacterium]
MAKRHTEHTNGKTPFQTHERQNLHGFVGDGFIRPEVASLCVNGRYPSVN